MILAQNIDRRQCSAPFFALRPMLNNLSIAATTTYDFDTRKKTCKNREKQG